MRPTLPVMMSQSLMSLRLMSLSLVSLTLIACQPVPNDRWVLYPPSGRDCGAADMQGLLGQNLAALPAQGPWSTLRVLRPGMMATMDYSESRLNARVDGQGTILDLSCG